MCAIFTCIFFDLDPVKSFPLRQAARAVAQQLGQIVEGYVKSVKATSLLSGLTDRFRKNKNALSDYGIHMIRRLLDSGLSVSEVTWSQVMPTAGAMIPNQSQVVGLPLSVFIFWLCYVPALTAPIVYSNHRLLSLH